MQSGNSAGAPLIVQTGTRERVEVDTVVVVAVNVIVVVGRHVRNMSSFMTAVSGACSDASNTTAPL